MKGGRKLTAAQAIVNPTFGSNWVFVVLRIRGNVIISLFVLTTSGHRKLFQAPTNVKIESVRMDGLISGMIIFHSILVLEHPSILAASISSLGTARIA